MSKPRGRERVNGLAIVAPTLEPIARFEIRVGSIVSLGASQWGERRVVSIEGGHFEGPRLRGVVLPGGADWQVVHADRMITIDARYTIETDDGATVNVTSRGVRHADHHVMDRLDRGEAVDPSEYYFRAAIGLETGAAKYLWLNQRLFLASAVRLARSVSYDLYCVT